MSIQGFTVPKMSLALWHHGLNSIHLAQFPCSEPEQHHPVPPAYRTSNKTGDNCFSLKVQGMPCSFPRMLLPPSPPQQGLQGGFPGARAILIPANSS